MIALLKTSNNNKNAFFKFNIHEWHCCESIRPERIKILTLKRRQSRLQQTTFINTFSFFSDKIRLDNFCKSSVRQRIYMKNQVLFSSKDKSKTLKCRLLQFSFGVIVRCHDKRFTRLNSEYRPSTCYRNNSPNHHMVLVFYSNNDKPRSQAVVSHARRKLRKELV